jgi:hypothetical protein
MTVGGIGDKGDYITPAVRAMIGGSGSVAEAPEPLDRSTIRRFAQAIMDDDPLYWDAEYASRTRYGRIMAPPLLPLHALRRPGGAPDPLQRVIDDPDYDGAGDVLGRMGLPRIPIPQKRLLNGGNDVRISSLAGVGDLIAAPRPRRGRHSCPCDGLKSGVGRVPLLLLSARFDARARLLKIGGTTLPSLRKVPCPRCYLR